MGPTKSKLATKTVITPEKQNIARAIKAGRRRLKAWRIDHKNKKISQKLVEIANEIVGHVGPSTDRSEAATGEHVIKYFVRFKDIKRVYCHFKNWIKAYCLMIDSYTLEGEGAIDSNKIKKKTIYWRQFPHIEFRNDFFYVRCRLLISDRAIRMFP